MSKEKRLGIIGNVDSGKTTLTSILINGGLDDGRGSKRAEVLKNKHEKDSGRTSSVTHNALKLEGNKSITLVDLAGHERYLKTTLHGLSGHLIDYTMLIVGANMGVQRMTREHLSIVLALNIPTVVVVTKTDLAPPKILKQTLGSIHKMILRMAAKRKMKREPVMINNEDDFVEITSELVPIFQISNKTGDGLDLLKKYIFNLRELDRLKESEKYDKLFTIESKFDVPGVGAVVCGKTIAGTIQKNDKLYVGPIYGKWIQVVAKSFHDNFKTSIEMLEAGDTGTIAFRCTNPANKALIKNRKNFAKGVFMISSEENLETLQTNFFEAEVKVLVNHSTTIRVKYEPIINCGKIVQVGKIHKIYTIDEHGAIKIKDTIHAGETAIVRFEFKYKPEFLEIGDTFLFREGRTKGVGTVTSIG